MISKREILKKMLSGRLTREDAQRQLQLQTDPAPYGGVIDWSDGTYSLGGSGPLTEAEALEYTGLESLEGLVHIQFK